jgi:hypothetical protein
MSVHELFKKSRLLAATTWQGRLDDARTESDVVSVVRDFMASIEPREIAMLPEPCQPGKFFDANDVTSFAFTLIRNECDADSESARLGKKLSAFFAGASIRLSQILARHGVEAEADNSRQSA